MKGEKMETLDIIKKIQSLPHDLQKDVADYIEFLEYKHQTDIRPKKRTFGLLKGKIHMTEDFDEPLEDFKEYT
jgi:hypothetical protein